MKIRHLLLLLVIALFQCGCDEKDESVILLFITPSEQYKTAAPGDLLKYEVKIQAQHELERLLVTQQIDNNASDVLLDSALSGKHFNFSMELNAPETIDSSLCLFLFKATDIRGNIVNHPIALIILNPGLLTESTGHTVYSHAGNNQDAFDLSVKEAIFSEESDSSIVDLIDATNDTLDATTLSRCWKSWNGTRFVRFNDFDYANAAYDNLIQVFEAGEKKSSITDIQADDIILIRTSGNLYYAARIVYVIDNDGITEDRYIFNIKEAKNPIDQ